MKYNFFLIALLALCSVGFSSCKDDDDDGNGCSTAWSAEVEDELEDMTAAAQAYGSNPNSTTCNAYKDAAQDYLDALESFLNCDRLTQQERNDLEAQIDQAEASVNAISC